MKRCSQCGEDRPLDGFYKDARARDGRRADCKRCANERSAGWAREHPDKRKEITKRYRSANKATLTAKYRDWELKNREKAAARKKRYRAANKQKVMARAAKYRDAHREETRSAARTYYSLNRQMILIGKRVAIAELRDSYVANKLRVTRFADVQPLVNAQRMRLLIHRAIKEPDKAEMHELQMLVGQLKDAALGHDSR